jgi:hypothetical protein
MSYVAPVVPTFLGVKNLEAKVQAMQLVVAANLPWLNYSFGLADRHVEQGDDGAYVYPATYMANGDPYDCMPNDRHAFSFWKCADPAELEYPDENAYDRWPYVVTEIDFILFANIKRIDNKMLPYITRSKLRQDVLHTLSNKMKGDFKLTPVAIYENDITAVYEDYSTEQIKNIMKQLPYWAIRVNCQLRYISDCPVNNAYGHGPHGVEYQVTSTGDYVVDGNNDPVPV